MNAITINTPGTVNIHLHASSQMPASLPATQSSTGLEWSKTLCGGKRVTHEEALKAIAELGPDWRLPTREELLTIVDLSRHDPAIDTEKFPDTKSEPYWTSTPCAWNDKARWVVGFGLGGVGNLLQSLNACVRAFRASQ